MQTDNQSAAPVDFGPVRAAARQLHEAVSALFAAYEAEERLNDIQPEAAAATYAASLDEWALQCHSAALAWDEMAAEAERRASVASDLEPGFRWLVEEAGFSGELAGGGCMVLSRYFEGAGYVWISCIDGGGLPSERDGWHVGVYPRGESGEALFQLRSDQVCPRNLRPVVEAALDMARQV